MNETDTQELPPINPTPDPLELVPPEERLAFYQDMTQAFMAWHGNRVARLKNFLDIPEGTIAEDNLGNSIVLEGDALKVFKIAIVVALSEVQNLPFIHDEEEDKEAQPT